MLALGYLLQTSNPHIDALAVYMLVQPLRHPTDYGPDCVFFYFIFKPLTACLRYLTSRELLR
ncbi:hypothetical protein I7I53_10752 [Histoplasma capsulatum var. duboisii H88]|uniref:Uncharacterized protein n=1 Tax=Ajellomyces capsulatus (strain H88) TaxID=544711 RepID=A0A8A1L870_AJEC8|nr:hypothetical protein I7I53_10752 [Histoplasma capsulatum var. duboisii H88]